LIRNTQSGVFGRLTFKKAKPPLAIFAFLKHWHISNLQYGKNYPVDYLETPVHLYGKPPGTLSAQIFRIS
jgi:hypothetical protein